MYGYPQEENNENVLEKYGRNIVKMLKLERLILLSVVMMKLEVLLEYYLVRQRIILF